MNLEVLVFYIVHTYDMSKLYSVSATVVTTIGDEIWANSQEEAEQIYYDRFSENGDEMVTCYYDRYMEIASVKDITALHEEDTDLLK